MSKCVYLASMAVKIEHTVGGHNHEITNNAYLTFMRAEVWGLNQGKLPKFVHCNIFANTEN